MSKSNKKGRFRGLFRRSQEEPGEHMNKQDEKLLRAVESDDITKIDLLLTNPKKPASATKLDSQGSTAFHRAASKGKIEIVQLLLKHKADTEALDKDGRTPLHCACRHGWANVTEVLLQANDTPGIGDQDSMTPLHHAALGGRIECIQVLRNHRAPVNALDSLNRTPLFPAAHMGHKDVAQELVVAGVDVNHQDHEGRTALSIAAERGNGKVAEFLLRQGADPSIKDSQGKDPLQYAQQSGHSGVQKLLGGSPEGATGGGAQAGPSAVRDQPPKKSKGKDQKDGEDLETADTSLYQEIPEIVPTHEMEAALNGASSAPSTLGRNEHVSSYMDAYKELEEESELLRQDYDRLANQNRELEDKVKALEQQAQEPQLQAASEEPQYYSPPPPPPLQLDESAAEEELKKTKEELEKERYETLALRQEYEDLKRQLTPRYPQDREFGDSDSEILDSLDSHQFAAASTPRTDPLIGQLRHRINNLEDENQDLREKLKHTIPIEFVRAVPVEEQEDEESKDKEAQTEEDELRELLRRVEYLEAERSTLMDQLQEAIVLSESRAENTLDEEIQTDLTAAEITQLEDSLYEIAPEVPAQPPPDAVQAVGDAVIVHEVLSAPEAAKLQETVSEQNQKLEDAETILDQLQNDNEELSAENERLREDLLMLQSLSTTPVKEQTQKVEEPAVKAEQAQAQQSAPPAPDVKDELINELAAEKEKLEKEIDAMKKNHTAGIQNMSDENKLLQEECAKLIDENDVLKKELDNNKPNEEMLQTLDSEVSRLQVENNALNDKLKEKDQVPSEEIQKLQEEKDAFERDLRTMIEQENNLLEELTKIQDENDRLAEQAQLSQARSQDLEKDLEKVKSGKEEIKPDEAKIVAAEVNKLKEENDKLLEEMQIIQDEDRVLVIECQRLADENAKLQEEVVKLNEKPIVVETVERVEAAPKQQVPPQSDAEKLLNNQIDVLEEQVKKQQEELQQLKEAEKQLLDELQKAKDQKPESKVGEPVPQAQNETPTKPSEDLKRLEEENKLLKDELKDFKKIINEHDKTIDDLNAKAKAVNEQNKNHADVVKERDDLKKQIEELETDIYKQVQDLSDAQKALLEDQAKVEEENQKLENENKTLKAALEQMPPVSFTEKIEVQKAEVQRSAPPTGEPDQGPYEPITVKEAQTVQKEPLDSIQAKIEESIIPATAKDVQAEVKETTESTIDRPAILKELTDENKNLKDQLKNQLTANEKEIDDLLDEINKLQNIRDELVTEKLDHDDNLNKIKEENAALHWQVEELSKQKPVVSEDASLALVAAQQESSELKEKCTALEKELENKPGDTETIAGLLTERAKLEDQIKEMQQQLEEANQMEKQIEDLQYQVVDIKESQNLKDLREDEIEDLIAEITKLKDENEMMGDQNAMLKSDLDRARYESSKNLKQSVDDAAFSAALEENAMLKQRVKDLESGITRQPSEVKVEETIQKEDMAPVSAAPTQAEESKTELPQNVEEKIRQLENHLQDARLREEELNPLIQQVQVLEAQKDSLNNENDLLKDENNNLQEELQNMLEEVKKAHEQDPDQLKKYTKELEDDYDVLSKEYEKVREDQTKLDDQLTDLIKAKETADTLNTLLSKDKAILEDQNKNLNDEMAKLIEEKDKLEKEGKRAEGEPDTAAVADEIEKLKQEHKTEIEKLNDELQKAAEKQIGEKEVIIAQLQGELEKLDAKEKEVEDMHQAQVELQQNLEYLQKQKDLENKHLEEQIGKLNEQLTTAKAKSDDQTAENAQLLDQLSQLQNLEETKDDRDDLLAALEEQQRNIDELRQASEVEKVELQKVSEALAKTEADKAEIEQVLSKMQEDLEKDKPQRQQIEEYKKNEEEILGALTKAQEEIDDLKKQDEQKLDKIKELEDQHKKLTDDQEKILQDVESIEADRIAKEQECEELKDILSAAGLAIVATDEPGKFKIEQVDEPQQETVVIKENAVPVQTVEELIQPTKVEKVKSAPPAPVAVKTVEESIQSTTVEQVQAAPPVPKEGPPREFTVEELLQQIEERDDEIALIIRKMEALEDENKELGNQIDDLVTERKTVEKQNEDRIQAMADVLDEMEADRTKLVKEKEDLEKEVAGLKEKLQQLEALQKGDAEVEKEINKLKEDRDQKDKAIEDLTGQVSAQAFEIHNLQDTKKENDELKKQIADADKIAEALKQKETELMAAEGKEKELAQELDQIQKAYEDLDTEKRDNDKLMTAKVEQLEDEQKQVIDEKQKLEDEKKALEEEKAKIVKDFDDLAAAVGAATAAEALEGKTAMTEQLEQRNKDMSELHNDRAALAKDYEAVCDQLDAVEKENAAKLAEAQDENKKLIELVEELQEYADNLGVSNAENAVLKEQNAHLNDQVKHLEEDLKKPENADKPGDMVELALLKDENEQLRRQAEDLQKALSELPVTPEDKALFEKELEKVDGHVQAMKTWEDPNAKLQNDPQKPLAQQMTALNDELGDCVDKLNDIEWLRRKLEDLLKKKGLPVKGEKPQEVVEQFDKNDAVFVSSTPRSRRDSADVEVQADLTDLRSLGKQLSEIEEENSLLRGTVRVLQDELDRLSPDVAENAERVKYLQGEVTKLTDKLKSTEQRHRDVVTVYRSHLLRAAEGNMDPEVETALKNIIKLREQEQREAQEQEAARAANMTNGLSPSGRSFSSSSRESELL